MKDPERVRERALTLFALLDQLDEPEKPVMGVLMDAVQIVEAYRGARHQVLGLPELTHSVDALMRELEIMERIKQSVAEDRRELPEATHPDADAGEPLTGDPLESSPLA